MSVGADFLRWFADFCQGSDGKIYGLITDLQRNKTADTNAGAFFTLIPRPVLSLNSLPGGGVRLSWNSISNGHYLVQFTPDLFTTWIDLTNLTATGTTAEQTNYPASQSSRFYRVMQTP